MADIPSILAQIIDNGGGSLKNDNWANGLFSVKGVLSRIVKACLPEYAPFSCRLIEEECFDDFSDSSGECHPEFAKALHTKRPLPNGYMMDCDLLFELQPPKRFRNEWRPQLLNVEVQNDSRKFDRCLARGMLYTSGIYYMEYGMIYTYPQFEKAQRVNSAWICPAALKKWQGRIMRFRMTAEGDGGGLLPPAMYDKLRMTVVNAGGDYGIGGGEEDLCGFIWVLTTPALTVDERKTLLKEVFKMDMTQVVEKILDHYDWLLDSYGRKRFADEKKQCEKVGFERGEKSGFEKGKESVIINMLKMKDPLDKISQATGKSTEEILQIARENNLTVL